MNHISRKAFLKQSFVFASSLAAIPALASSDNKRNKTILLRSSWQVENIGDIAHTPGVLALIEKYLPNVDVRLWPMDVEAGVEEMLMTRFPKLKILKTEEAQQRAIKECDFFLHGSGPSLVGRHEMLRWKKETGKPYVITFPGNYGFQPHSDKYDPLDMELFNGAAFTYFRDSVSFQFAKLKGINCPIIGFCPDGAFAIDVRNDKAADLFLKEHALEIGKFVCVIPQLRFSPWWELPLKKTTVNQEKHAWNEKMKEHDNLPIRNAISEVIRQTDLKVIIPCNSNNHIAIR